VVGEDAKYNPHALRKVFNSFCEITNSISSRGECCMKFFKADEEEEWDDDDFEEEEWEEEEEE
jgi:hypothetical protein